MHAFLDVVRHEKSKDIFRIAVPLRVQVPKNHILTQNLYYNYYYPNPKYLVIGYMDPLGPTMYLVPSSINQTLKMKGMLT